MVNGKTWSVPAWMPTMARSPSSEVAVLMTTFRVTVGSL